MKKHTESTPYYEDPGVYGERGAARKPMTAAACGILACRLRSKARGPGEYLLCMEGYDPRL